MKGKNPKGWTLPIGKHSVELRVYQKGEVIPYYTQFYPLEVIQKKVLKKPKKIKMKKAKTKKSPKKVAASPLIPEANAMGNQSSESQGMSATPFLLGIILYVFLRRRTLLSKI